MRRHRPRNHIWVASVAWVGCCACGDRRRWATAAMVALGVLGEQHNPMGTHSLVLQWGCGVRCDKAAPATGCQAKARPGTQQAVWVPTVDWTL